MCDTYRYIEISIFSFNIVIQYWLLGVLIHWCGQFSNLVFLICIILYLISNYNKLVCITLIDFFYHFLTTKTKQDIYIYFISISIIVSNIVILHVSYRDIFGSNTCTLNTQYYFKHIPRLIIQLKRGVVIYTSLGAYVIID